MKALTTREFWEERHARFRPEKYYPAPHKDYLDFVLAALLHPLLGTRPRQKILEVGCGGSVWLPYFRKVYGLEITGVDYSRTGIALSREILGRNEVDGRLIQADIFEPDIALAGSFDIAFSLGFIEHFDDPSDVLRIITGFLRPGGLLLTWVPNTAGWILQAGRALDKKRRNIYSPLDLKRLIGMHHALNMRIMVSAYTQFLDLSFLSFPFLPAAIQKGLSLIFQGVNIVLIGYHGPFLFASDPGPCAARCSSLP